MTKLQCPQCRTEVDAATTDDTVKCGSCGAEIDTRLTLHFDEQSQPTAQPTDRPSDRIVLSPEQRTETIAHRGNAPAQRPSRENRIGHYRLVRQLGRGSFGEVWQAIDERLDRVVAIKMPRAGMFSDSQLSGFLHEARAIAKLNHAGIVSVHEVGQTSAGPYIVTEFIDGQDLKEYLERESLTTEEAVKLSVSMGEAIAHAHRHGVVHRDLKPANVMMDRQGCPHVMDFGLAKQVTEAGVRQTVDGQIMGTPAYMSPEQARGESRLVDGRSDVYSLGVMLFEFLTGELPFRGKAAMLLRQVIESEPPPPRSLNGAVSLDLQNICLKCLQKAPEHRYHSADEYVADLRAFLEHKPVSARPATWWQRFNKWCRRNPVAASLTSLAVSFLVAMLILSVFFLVRERKLRKSVERAFEREATALRETERTATDLKRQRDGLAAAQSVLASTQKEISAQGREFASRLYAHSINDCDRWINEGQVLRARVKLDSMAEQDPERQLRCWAWDYLDAKLSPYTWYSLKRSRVERVVSNHDGSQLFVLYQSGELQRSRVEGASLIQLATPVELDGRVRDFDFHSESGRLAIVMKTGALSVFDPQGEELVAGEKSQEKYDLVRFCPSGEKLFARNEDQSVQIFGVPDLNLVSTWRLPGQARSNMAWSPDNETLAIATDKNVSFRSVADGTERGSAELPNSTSSIDWSGTGNHLLVASQRDAWRINANNQEKQLIARITTGAAAIVSGVTDESAWILHHSGRLSQWSTQESRRLQTAVVFDGVGSAICCSNDKSRLFAAAATGKILAVRLNQPPKPDLKTLRHSATVRRVDWRPDGKQIAAADWSGRFAVWDIEEAEQRFTTQVCEPGHFCETATWSPDGNQIATSSTAGEVAIWDGQSGEKLATLGKHRGTAYGIHWHPRLPYLASAGTAGIVKIWDTKAQKELESWQVHSTVEQVAWSPEGKYLLAVGHYLSMRNEENGNVVLQEFAGASSFFDVAFHPDQSRFAVCDARGRVSIGSFAEPRKREDFRASEMGVRSLGWSPDGKCLVTADVGGAINLWHADTRNHLLALVNPSQAIVWSVAFSPDGKQLAAAQGNGVISIWSVELE